VTAPILWKHPDLEDELLRSDRRLRVVVYYAAALSLFYFGKPLVVTRVQSHRSEVEGFYGAGARPSVHEAFPCRGCDARSRDHYTSPEIATLVSAVNHAFEYRRGDRGVQAALHETVEVMRRLGRVNPTEDMEHLHLQVPPVPRGESDKVRLWYPP